MKRVLKKYFVPHQENEYKPHFFREASIGFVALVAVVLLVSSMTSSWVIRNTGLGASVLSSVLVDMANETRVENDETPFVFNATLEKAATLKASDMAEKEYFAHTSPEGLTPWHWFSLAGYHFVYAGENLAVDFSESEDVHRAWLDSPTHRANILNAKFSEIGIATKDGYLDGKKTTFVVQMFGTPIAFADTVAPKPSETQLASVPLPPKNETTPKESVVVTTPIVPTVETIQETNTFVAVKNTEVPEPQVLAETTTTVAPQKYANWFERLLVFEPNHVNTIYIILIGFILIALGVMVFVEFRTQHPKNIAYGAGVVGLLVAMVIVNYFFFVPNFV